MTGLPENPAGLRHPLERLLAPVEPIAVSDPSWAAAPDTPTDALVHCRVGSGQPTRVRTGDWQLYARLDGVSDGADTDEAIASFVAEGGRVARAYRARDGRVVVPFGFAEAYAGYAAELWAEGAAPFGLSPGLLNVFYRLKHAIPRRAQLAARRVLIRGQGEPDFPRWPFDASVAALLRFYVRCALVAERKQALRFRWFWPQGARAAVILTHDVESDGGASQRRSDRRSGAGAGPALVVQHRRLRISDRLGDRRGAAGAWLRARRPRRLPRPLVVLVAAGVRPPAPGSARNGGARRG